MTRTCNVLAVLLVLIAFRPAEPFFPIPKIPTKLVKDASKLTKEAARQIRDTVFELRDSLKTRMEQDIMSQKDDIVRLIENLQDDFKHGRFRQAQSRIREGMKILTRKKETAMKKFSVDLREIVNKLQENAKKIWDNTLTSMPQIIEDITLELPHFRKRFGRERKKVLGKNNRKHAVSGRTRKERMIAYFGTDKSFETDVDESVDAVDFDAEDIPKNRHH